MKKKQKEKIQSMTLSTLQSQLHEKQKTVAEIFLKRKEEKNTNKIRTTKREIALIQTCITQQIYAEKIKSGGGDDA